MKTQLTKIETELNQTTARIGELTEMRTGVNSNLQTLQQDFIDGKTSFADLQAAQGELMTLNASIKALEVRQTELHTVFQKESLTESRRTLIDAANEAANAVEPFLNDYLETRNELNSILAEYAKTLTEKATAYQSQQAIYQTAVRQIEPPATLAESPLSDNARRLASATYLNHPPIEYGDIIALAEKLLAAKINSAAAKKRQSEFNAMTAKSI